jgi:hypothetical protein
MSLAKKLFFSNLHRREYSKSIEWPNGIEPAPERWQGSI